MGIDDLWRRLAASQSFSLTVHPGQWSPHVGNGTITIEQHTHSVILWHEQGAWSDGPLAGIRFSNTTCWERLSEVELRISHQRRGPEPVMLSTLRPDHGGTWTGDPHHCGADLYRPTLSAGSILQIEWDVSSPTDPYRWQLKAS